MGLLIYTGKRPHLGQFLPRNAFITWSRVRETLRGKEKIAKEGGRGSSINHQDAQGRKASGNHLIVEGSP